MANQVYGPPILAVTMGDPSGIGPEVIVKALASSTLIDREGIVVIGDIRPLRVVSTTLGINLTIRAIGDLSEIGSEPGAIDVLDLGNADPADFGIGQVNATAGRAAMMAIERAATLALSGAIAAMVTAPINKEATLMAGYSEIGHLEFLGRISGSREYATMLVSGSLRVVHLTTHHSLRQACELVQRERILGRLRLTHSSFRAWGLGTPRIGLAALNPHGGEGGLFGDEEQTEIIPAIERARAEGIDARGPYPADSIFNQAIDGGFDAVLAMYHDQGHIPIKVHGFAESVSVALGLPFVRTSVDHGTAFDIAGQGKADERSMIWAIKTARSIVNGTWLS